MVTHEGCHQLRAFDVPTSDTQVLAALSRGLPEKWVVSEIGTYLPSGGVGKGSEYVSVSSRPRYILALPSITFTKTLPRYGFRTSQFSANHGQIGLAAAFPVAPSDSLLYFAGAVARLLLVAVALGVPSSLLIWNVCVFLVGDHATSWATRAVR
jgi:hypothetical protein